MNVFNLDFGLHQGRIARADAPDGAFVYELGHAKLRDCFVKSGDFHQVSQSFQLTPNAKFIVASVAITTPQPLPADASWQLSAALNTVVMVSRKLRPSKRIIKLEDWRISLVAANAAPATNTLTFRLELI